MNKLLFFLMVTWVTTLGNKSWIFTHDYSGEKRAWDIFLGQRNRRFWLHCNSDLSFTNKWCFNICKFGMFITLGMSLHVIKFI